MIWFSHEESHQQQRHTHSVHMSKVKNDASRRSRPPTDPRPLLRLIPLPSSTQVTPCLAWRRARRVGRRVDGDSEARRGPKFRTSQRLYIEWTAPTPPECWPVPQPVFFFSPLLAAAWNPIIICSLRRGAVAVARRSRRPQVIRLAFCQTEAEL